MGGGKSNCGEEREWALLVLCLNMRVYKCAFIFRVATVHSAGVLRNTCGRLHQRLEVTRCTYKYRGYFHVYPFGQIPITFCVDCFSCTWTCMFIHSHK